jgi:hypothetical protein
VSIIVEKISVLSVSSVAIKKQRNQRNLRQKNSCQSYELDIVDTFLVSFTNGALQNDPVDEGGWFSQMLASRKTTAEYT